jgi:hypothetical protein
MGETLKDDKKYYSCCYNKLQFFLFLIALIMFGIGDTISSINLIEQKGIMGEGNFIVRQIILNYGISNYLTIKISVTMVLLFLPFLLIDKTAYWMITGYLVSFIIAGTLGTVLNMQAANNGVPFLSPEQAIGIFMISVLILTNIGDEIDKKANLKIRSHFDCMLKDMVIILTYIINNLKDSK